MGNQPSSDTQQRSGRTSSSVLTSPDEDDPNLLRHPYIDPNTGLSLDTNHPTREGPMSKQSDWIKEWRKRYFILKDSRLFFSKGRFVHPHGVIDLTESRGVSAKRRTDSPTRGYEFEVKTKGETWNLRCATSEDRDGWVNEIHFAITHSLSKIEF